MKNIRKCADIQLLSRIEKPTAAYGIKAIEG
jgi:hypothetical protein